MKRAISILLSIIMVLSIFTIIPFSVNAVTSGVWKYQLLDDGTAEITGCFDSKRNLTIPSEIDGKTVTKIGSRAFENRTELISVTIPDSVTEISILAFDGCTGMTDVNLHIKDFETFYNSSWSLIKKRLGNRNFHLYMNGELLTKIDIPDSLTSLDHRVLSYCPDIVSIRIPKHLSEISSNAFYGCISLTSITVDPESRTFDSRDNCNAIIDKKNNTLLLGCKSTFIPDSVTSIEVSAFENCVGLTSITIPDSVTSIGFYAFYGCIGLTSITIPNSVMRIDESTFYGCTGLTCVTIPDSVMRIDDAAFFGCTSLTSVKIPDSVRGIGDSAFFGCTSLTSATISKSVKEFGDKAFGYYKDDEGNYKKVDEFTIYGYEGSEAEYYAWDNYFDFVKFTAKTDESSGISLDLSDDNEISVSTLTEQQAGDIAKDLPENLTAEATYEINVTKDGSAVQPEYAVNVKIPYVDNNAKVYFKEADGSLTDLKAVFKDGNYEFSTTQFGIFVVAEEKPAPVPTEPAIEEPTEPETAEPTEPVTTNPTEPVETQPVTTEPTEPATTVPAEPTGTQPVTDKPTEPVETQPATDKPTEPETSEPTEPITTEPTEPITTEPTQPATAKPTEPAVTEPQPTTPVPTTPVVEPTQPNKVTPSATVKKANPIKVTVKAKTVKLKKLKKKAQTVKAITIKGAQGKVSCKITKAAKIKKFLKINAKGVITFKAWKKAKKGTYKIKVKITAKGNDKFNSKSFTKTVKIKIK